MENGNCVFNKNDLILISENQDESEKELKYCEYLKLEKLLSAQCLRSVECNQPAHHEHLFIITHQAYELWFKQIIFELDSLKEMFKIGKIEYEDPHEIIKRLHRIGLILKLLIEQLTILETMTPLDFLEFRDFLCPASGFQSLQFRLIENKLGLSQKDRVQFQKDFMNRHNFGEPAYQSLKESENESNLLMLVQEWLEHYPWQFTNGINFETVYKIGVQKFLNDKHSSLAESGRLKNKELLFESLFNADLHLQLVNQKERKLSQKALLGAIIIAIYHSEPQFNAAYQIINLIIDIDLQLTKWRTNHMLMVQKMIGSQSIGTGGSSGYHYLRSTLNDQYKVFADLANLPAYLIPPSYLPQIGTSKKTKNNQGHI